jgi:hypothetical protein
MPDVITGFEFGSKRRNHAALGESNYGWGKGQDQRENKASVRNCMFGSHKISKIDLRLSITT